MRYGGVDAYRIEGVGLDDDVDADVDWGARLRTALTHGGNLHAEGIHGTRAAQTVPQVQARTEGEQGTRSRRAVGT
jgi:hypothetical protein